MVRAHARNYMSLAAHFQDKTAIFADLDLGTARELIDSPTEVSEPRLVKILARKRSRRLSG